ncbi:MAG: 2-oxoacid:acceptor oxidoreductase family protein [Patescibacteria group bacterium]|jgi:pyruvate ferredoxin oxidoreductase gamma subunit
MIQVRIHGRGGQGVVTSAELIAVAAFLDGKEAQAFPYFGVERRGAPIMAFARIDSKPIRLREHVYHPDIIIVQDATLLGAVNLSEGAAAKAIMIVNTTKLPEEVSRLAGFPASSIHTFDATKIALDTIGRNIVNTVILGALSKIAGVISLKSLEAAIKEQLESKGPEVVKRNIAAIEKAYASIK